MHEFVVIVLYIRIAVTYQCQYYYYYSNERSLLLPVAINRKVKSMMKAIKIRWCQPIR